MKNVVRTYIFTIMLAILCTSCATTEATPIRTFDISLTRPTAQATQPSGESPTALPSESTPTIAPPTPTPILMPYHTDNTNPDKFGLRTEVSVNGVTTDSYVRNERITFKSGDEYTDVKGVTTFRGNNYRDTSGVYGVQSIIRRGFSIEPLWRRETGSMTTDSGDYWSGCGWTGQPLITEWSRKMRQSMDMFEWAQTQDELTEVIYGTEDGKIYFYELETGKPTRDPINCGFIIKGAGSLDPRGIPLMYVGGGDVNNGKLPRAFIISLVTNEIIYEFGNNDPFAMRRWCAFDSAPLVDAETDTLIWPCENGICYFIKLGTEYNQDSGQLSISPSEVVRWRYSAKRSAVNNKFWLGIESSVIVYQGYMFFPDNGGHMMCLDINTLELVWVQDVLDDTNCTGVLEIEDGKPYIYMSTSFHGGWRKGEEETADIPVWKLDAENGEVVWRTDYTCHTRQGNSGGAQGSLAVGKGTLKDIVYIPMGRTPGRDEGLLVALNKHTGEEIWSLRLDYYIWSSPVIVYDNVSGAGYVIQGDSNGNLFFIDGLSGEILDVFEMDGNIEATPAVYNGILVLGTRACSIYALKLE